MRNLADRHRNASRPVFLRITDYASKNSSWIFLCHLCIEKSIKAHIVRVTGQLPPRSHKLSYLLELTDLVVSEDDKDFCALLMIYQLEGRYPEYLPVVPERNVAEDLLNKTKLLHQWLRERL